MPETERNESHPCHRAGRDPAIAGLEAVPHVCLRPLEASDAPAIHRWLQDPRVFRFTIVVPGPEFEVPRPFTAQQAEQYLATLMRDPQRRSFAVCEGGRHVGNVGLRGVDPGAGTAECFIEIGEFDARRKGIGRAAMHLLLEFAFVREGLSRVTLGVFEFNLPAIQLYRKLGFVDEGHYGTHWAEGQLWEVRAMVLTRARWRRLLDFHPQQLLSDQHEIAVHERGATPRPEEGPIGAAQVLHEHPIAARKERAMPAGDERVGWKHQGALVSTDVK